MLLCATLGLTKKGFGFCKSIPKRSNGLQVYPKSDGTSFQGSKN